MEEGRVTETERMLSLVGDNTETVCSKLKRGNRFSEPNFEWGPSWTPFSYLNTYAAT